MNVPFLPLWNYLQIGLNVRFIFLILLLNSCQCKNRLSQAPDPLCNQPCYEGDKLQAGIGACNYGKYECDENNQFPVCKGWGTPTLEICDNIDNDCSGRTDGIPQECSSVCEIGNQICVNGQWSSCSARNPTTEICDNIDNNCNGIIDDINKSCYTGPPGTETLGECHSGSARCDGYTEICFGEQTPVHEICDGKDQNCNGLVDDGINKPVDVVFIVDFSGSMEPQIKTIVFAIDSWKNSYNSQDYKFALVASPDPFAMHDGLILLETNFTDSAAFIVELLQLADVQSETGIEYTWQAIKLVADSANLLGLSWRSNASRMVVLISDEHDDEQNLPNAVSIRDAALLSASAAVPKIQFDFFINTNDIQDYQPIADATGGKVFNIFEPVIDIKTHLDQQIISVACQ